MNLLTLAEFVLSLNLSFNCRFPVLQNSGIHISAATVFSDNSAERQSFETLHGCTSQCYSSTPNAFCENSGGLYLPSSWVANERNFNTGTATAGYLQNSNAFGKLDQAQNLGLEFNHVIFYFGHGGLKEDTRSPYIMADGQAIPVSKISLGDINGRYLFLNSCRTLAHGPLAPYEVASSQGPKIYSDYISPESFANGDVSTLANWFAPSESPLNPRLRLACGGSSQLSRRAKFPFSNFFALQQIIKIPISTAFEIGLRADNHSIPVCMTRSGAQIRKSPLFDRTFTTEANPSASRISNGRGYLYLEYVVDLMPNDGLKTTMNSDAEDKYDFREFHEGVPPPVEVSTYTLPKWLQIGPEAGYGFRATKLVKDFSSNVIRAEQQPQVSPDDFLIVFNPQSGALIANSKSPRALKSLLEGISPSQKRSLHDVSHELAMALSRQFMPSLDFSELHLTDLYLVRVDQMKEYSDATKSFPKCVFARFSQHLMNNSNLYQLAGPGTGIILHFCPRGHSLRGPEGRWSGDGTITFSSNVRSLGSPLDPSRFKPVDFSTAKDTSGRWLEGQENHYVLSLPVETKYHLAPPHCGQDLVIPFFSFTYMPADVDLLPELPPLIVEIPAVDLESFEPAILQCSRERDGTIFSFPY